MCKRLGTCDAILFISNSKLTSSYVTALLPYSTEQNLKQKFYKSCRGPHFGNSQVMICTSRNYTIKYYGTRCTSPSNFIVNIALSLLEFNSKSTLRRF